jgi:hypothetical protein
MVSGGEELAVDVGELATPPRISWRSLCADTRNRVDADYHESADGGPDMGNA